MTNLCRLTVACLALLMVYVSVGATPTYRDDAPANAVRIANQKFAPATITVKAGETVKWTNADNRDHKLVAKDGSWRSENLRHGATFTHTFAAAGTFDYACEYLPRMKGTVVVK